MLDKTKNYKIDVSQMNTAERTKLQEELFKQGYRWFDGEQEVDELDMSFLFLYKDMDITYCEKWAEFDSSDHTPILVTDIMPQSEERTLRDWFAGLVMQGLFSNPEVKRDFSLIAESSFVIADAMLKERNK